MIKEIFISRLDNTLLLGNPNNYPNNTKGLVSAEGGLRFIQIKHDDIFLSCLYNEMNTFLALKHLMDIKNKLLAKFYVLDEESVKSKYFYILSFLSDPTSLVLCPVERKAIARIPTKSLYLDLVETVDAIVENDKVIKNIVKGHVFSRSENISKIKALNISISKSEKNLVHFKTDYIINESLNSVEICARNIVPMDTLVTYHTCLLNPLIKLTRNDNRITIRTREKKYFKFLEIIIPMSRTTFRAKKKSGVGDVMFDMEECVVRWRMENMEVVNETLILETKSREKKPMDNVHYIKFLIPGYSETGIKIENIKPSDTSLVFWGRSTFQDSCYEVRL